MEKNKSKKLRTNNNRLKIFLISFCSIIIVIVISFCLLGSKFLKFNYNKNKVTEVLVHSNYDKPRIKCTFLNINVPNENIKIIKDIDINKIGKQSLEYECKFLFFKKNFKIEYNVVDKESPELKLNGENNINIYVGEKYQESGATAIDNYDGDITDKIEITGEISTDTVGTYEISYKVADSSKNESSVIRTVTVNAQINQKNTTQKNSSINSSNTSCGRPGTIYLTFDDGPNETYTKVILDVLKKYNVKATFFVTNSGPDDLIKREFDEGHAIALHTATHVYSQVYASDEAYWSDINSVSNRVERITGHKSKLIRFPGGSSNTISRRYSEGIMSRLVEQMAEKGYSYFDWNISSGDAGGTTDPNVEYNNVINFLSKSRGNVILMHDIKYHTSQAIEGIVKYGLDNGYTFDILTSDVICHQQINN